MGQGCFNTRGCHKRPIDYEILEYHAFPASFGDKLLGCSVMVTITIALLLRATLHFKIKKRAPSTKVWLSLF